jgi:outer membrane protein W
MKKLSLLVGGLILSTAVMAQKPDASVHNTLEGLINWNTSTLSFTSPSIRYRYFVQDNIAVRVTLGVHNSSSTDNFFEFGDGTGGTGSFENKSSNLNFSIGGEYHFGGTDRLSPYAGLDIMLGSGKVTTDGTNSDGATFIDTYTETSEAKSSMFGVNLVAGTDYYFAENFYLGLELGLGWTSNTQKEGEATTGFGGTTTKSVTAESKSSGINTGAVGSFRLGWRF